MKNWLIRTKQNQIIGPLEREKVLEFLEKGDLKDDDELATGNGHWFYIKETGLLNEYLYQGKVQPFNPVSEADTILAADPKLIAELLPPRESQAESNGPAEGQTSEHIERSFDFAKEDLKLANAREIVRGDEFQMEDMTSSNLSLEELRPAKKDEENEFVDFEGMELSDLVEATREYSVVEHLGENDDEEREDITQTLRVGAIAKDENDSSISPAEKKLDEEEFGFVQAPIPKKEDFREKNSLQALGRDLEREKKERKESDKPQKVRVEKVSSHSSPSKPEAEVILDFDGFDKVKEAMAVRKESVNQLQKQKQERILKEEKKKNIKEYFYLVLLGILAVALLSAIGYYYFGVLQGKKSVSEMKSLFFTDAHAQDLVSLELKKKKIISFQI